MPSSPPQLEQPAQQEAARATTGASVVRGGIWSATSSLGPQLFTLAISIAAARFLGPAGLGRQSFIAFVVYTTINVVGLGLQTSLMRAVGELVGAGRSAEARGLIRWGWRVLGIGAVGSTAGLLVVALTGADPRIAWILAAATAGVGVLTDAPGAALFGLQRWRDQSLVLLACGFVGAIATIVVLAAGGGITGMFAVQLAVSTAIFAGLAAFARRRLKAIAPAAVRPSHALRRHTLRYAGSAFVGSLVTLIVFRRSEFFFLQHWSSDREIALYSVSFSAVTTLVLVPQALAVAVSPAFATLLGAGQHERIRSGYARVLRLLLIACLPLAAGALALGPETLQLVFGRGFAGSRVPLLVLLAPFPLIPLMNASYSLIVGLGNARFPLFIGAASATLNLVLDFALIPGHGAVGAAIANACAQGATALATIAYGTRLSGRISWHVDSLVRAFAASAAAGAAAWATLRVVGGTAGVVSGLLAGTAVFAGSAIVLRVLPASDAAWIERTFGTLLGGRVGLALKWIAAREAVAEA